MRGAEPPSSLMTSCTNFLLLWPPLLMSVATVELGVPLWLERELLRLCFLEAENKLAVESVLTLVTLSLGLLRDVSVMDIALVSASLLGDEPELELIIETDTWRETPEIGVAAALLSGKGDIQCRVFRRVYAVVGALGDERDIRHSSR